MLPVERANSSWLPLLPGVLFGLLGVAQFGLLSFGDHLPRDEVAVMFQLGEQNFVARLQVLQRPSCRDEVDALGGAAGEDDFLRGAGVDELRDAFARGFVGAGRTIAQFMNTPVNVGVVVLVVALDRIKDGTGLLRCGGAVEVDERMAVDFLIKDREILP